MPHIFQVIQEGLSQVGRGGSLLIPLLFCSLFSHAIILDRLYNLRRGKLMPRRFIARIYRVLERGNVDTALSLCKSRPGPLTNILKVGIENRHLPKEELRTVIDATARLEKLRLQKYLRTLAFIGGVSVIIGLLGTVVGIFIAIRVAWRADRPDTGSMVAGGISIALITTAAGLVVALPAMIGYAYFMAKSESMIDEMTRHSYSLVRFFTTGKSELVRQESEQSDA